MFETDTPYEEAIAITGMSCRFPGAKNINEFWYNLKNGVESLTSFTDDELKASDVPSNLLDNPNYVKAACVLDDIESFDASFFGYSVQEAELLDPQQRLLLECAYEALEDAGAVSQRSERRIGVFSGMRYSGYAKVLDPLIQQLGTVKSFEAFLGVSIDQVSMRISYALDLKGPSVGVQTACSTFLVAAHMACESIRNGECDMALAGAATIFIPKKIGYLYEEGMTTSFDGHCRAFDANAKGAGLGSGVGIVVLKRFAEAIADHDQIYAVIRGDAVNNDGSSKAGIRTPSVEGEMDVIAEALGMAGIKPENISYVEANGTGTLIGDSMELDALSRVFQAQTDKKGFCRIGSVKTNVGHMAQASGVAGLIKTSLCLKEKWFVPSLYFETPNPRLADSPFHVGTDSSMWETDNSSRYAVINSFAIGGTNACMVLEEALERHMPSNDNMRNGSQIITLSAKSERALKDLASRYEKFLKDQTDASLMDICFTANTAREHFSNRFSSVVNSTEQLYERISCLAQGKTPMACALRKIENVSAPKIGFFFADQGSQYIGMGKKLYETQPLFKESLDECAEILDAHLDKPILHLIFGKAEDLSLINTGTYAQPILFALEYALANMWRAWGIEPFLLMGCGVGEYVAACIAGVFDLRDGLMLIAARGRLERYLPLNEELAASFDKVAEKVTYSTPAIRLIPPHHLFTSTTNKAMNHPEYWCRQVRKPKGERSGLETVFTGECELFLEIGPGSDLIKITKEYFPQYTETCFPSLDGERDDWQRVLESLSELYVRGTEIDWMALNQGARVRRISLPTYPFERERCWFDPEKPRDSMR